MTPSCVDISELRAYCLGTIGWEQAAVLERHVETCETCRTTLETIELEADELVAGLRGARLVTATGGDPEVDLLVARLALSGSTRGLRAGETSEEGGGFDLASELQAGAGRPFASTEFAIGSGGLSGAVPSSAAELQDALCDSGVFSGEDLRRVVAAAPPEGSSDPVSLARWLVHQGHLTCYQAGEACLGRADGLLLDGNLLLDELGRGGMGCVYRARNVRMGREVAVKRLAPHLFSHPGTRERFRRETRAIAALSHPHVLTAYHAGQYAGGEYLVMEFAGGCDLSRLVKKSGPVSWRRAVHFIRQAALGLQAAHDRGIVHRDVKPSNLMSFLDGTVKVADLGLARFTSTDDSADSLTSAGHVMGTVDYMSPEQAFDTEQVDGRSDIYSLGWTLYHLLTGRVPYDDVSGLGKLQSHREGHIPSLREEVPDVPEPLDELFQRMVAKDPADRPQAMKLVVDALTPLVPEDLDAGLPAELAERESPDVDAFFTRLAPRVEKARQAQAASRTAVATKIPAGGRGRWVWIAAGLSGCLLLAVAAPMLLLPERQYARHAAPGEPDMPAPRQTAPAVEPLETVEPDLPRELERDAAAEAGTGSTTEPRPRPMEDIEAVTASESEPDPAPPELFGQIGQVSIPQRVVAIVLSPDKKTVYAASTDKSVYVIDVATMTKTGRFSGHRNPISDLAVSRDGSLLVSCSGDRTIRIWDLNQRETIQAVPLPVPPFRVAISPDGRLVLTSLMTTAPVFPRPRMPPRQREFRSLMLLDVETGDVVRQITEDRETVHWSVAFSPDGKWIAAGSKEGAIRLIDSATGEPAGEIPNRPGPTHCLRFTDDGERLYAGNALFIQCYSVPEGEVLYRYGLRHGITGLDVSADESQLLAEGTIDVRVVDADVFGPEAVTNLHGHESPISGLLFLADESRAVSSAWDGTVRFWKLPPRRARQ